MSGIQAVTFSEALRRALSPSTRSLWCKRRCPKGSALHNCPHATKSQGARKYAFPIGGYAHLPMTKSCPLPQKSRPASLLRRIPRGIGGFPQVSCSSVCSFQMSPHPLPSASLPQSRWNTFCRSMLTGLLSGLVSMMSAMKSHHLRLMAVSAPLAQSASSSISM